METGKESEFPAIGKHRQNHRRTTWRAQGEHAKSTRRPQGEHKESTRRQEKEKGERRDRML